MPTGAAAIFLAAIPNVDAGHGLIDAARAVVWVVVAARRGRASAPRSRAAASPPASVAAAAVPPEFREAALRGDDLVSRRRY